MALIFCPECKQEISDKAKTCIYCGYPMDEYRIQNYKINQNSYDLTFVLDSSIPKINKIKILHELSNCGLKESMDIVHSIYDEYNIQDNIKNQPDLTENKINVPRCPTCNSTKIKKISNISKAASVGMWGIFSRKVHKQWHCNNCGSEW